MTNELLRVAVALRNEGDISKQTGQRDRLHALADRIELVVVMLRKLPES